jgi:hypothetical protein
MSGRPLSGHSERRYAPYDFTSNGRMLSGAKIAIAGSNALPCRSKKYAQIKPSSVAQSAR